MRERGPVTARRQHLTGRGTTDPILSQRTACGPATMTGTRLPAIPLPARPGLTAACPLSPGFPRQPSQWPGGEQALCYQGVPRHQGEHPLSYENQQFYAGAYQHRPQTGPHDSYHQAWQSYASPGTAYTSPWTSYGYQSARPAPTWYQPGQPSPGHHWGTRPNWHGSSPQAQALAWEHANGSGRGASSLPPAGNPPTARNPSASDSSAAEANPKDRSPWSRSRNKRWGHEAPASAGKRRKAASSDRRHTALVLFLELRRGRISEHHSSGGS